MKALRIAAVTAGLFAPLLTLADAQALILPDGTLIQSFQANAVANPPAGTTTPPPVTAGNWYNTVGPASIFETVALEVLTNGNITVRAFTNFPINYAGTLGGLTVLMADLAIDTNGDGVFEYGVASTTRGAITQGTLYQVTDWTTSREKYAAAGTPTARPFYGGNWDNCDNSAIPCNNPKIPDVLINTGNAVSAGSASQRASNAGDPNLGIPYAFVMEWVINGLTLAPNQKFAFFWGTADCANDSIYGEITGGGDVPEPVGLALFGFGLLALAGAARQRARASV